MKKTLVLGTALALLAATGVAYAGGNETYLEQLGDGNSASTGQDSAAVVGNQAGIDTDSMKQTGDNNVLSITQGGDQNAVGIHSSKGTNLGLDQNGDRNSITVGQSKGQNKIYQVQQTGDSDATSQQNVLTITQGNQGGGYGASAITIVNQTNTGGAAAAANSVDIEQTAFHAGPGANNGVGRLVNGGDQLGGGITQVGSGLGATIHQVGGHNKIRSVTQYGTSDTVTINQSGAAGNGSDGQNNAVNSVEQGASGSGVSTSTIAINQYGDKNYVGRVQQTGGGNNHVTMTFVGDKNGGDGSGNSGSAALFASTIVGNVGLNESETYQTGTDNNLTYTVTGSENLFAFNQIGSGNTIDGTVGDTSASSSNEVAILQNSSGNTANFSQTGAGSNNLAVKQ